MLILDTPAAMRAWSADQHRAPTVIGLVPTMGDLHAGHLALIDSAVTRCDAVVVSIFVNPLQFNRTDDFDLYPRNLEADFARCAEHGVTTIYSPTMESMYPGDFETHVEPGKLADPLEGAGRPGHFRGVATVVAKLFAAVHPDIAVFGRKDFQQLAVVRRMVADLDMGIEIVAVDTVREPDGVAMSSRNRRLNVEQRDAAAVVPHALAVIADGDGDLQGRRSRATALIDAEPLARLEYLEVVDPTTLQAPAEPTGELLAVIAVWFGDVRLIDNREFVGS